MRRFLWRLSVVPVSVFLIAWAGLSLWAMMLEVLFWIITGINKVQYNMDLCEKTTDKYIDMLRKGVG